MRRFQALVEGSGPFEKILRSI